MSEQLKRQVLAKCTDVTKGSKMWETAMMEPFTQVLCEDFVDCGHQFTITSSIDEGDITVAVSMEVPADSFLWSIAAKLLQIAEPRLSNELLWEAFGKGRFSAQSPIKLATEFYKEWLATIPPDPLADDRAIPTMKEIHFVAVDESNADRHGWQSLNQKPAYVDGFEDGSRWAIKRLAGMEVGLIETPKERTLEDDCNEWIESNNKDKTRI